MRRVLAVTAGFVTAVAVALPAYIAPPAAAHQPDAAVAAVKCINMRTGIQRNLAGRSCPRGWVRAVPLATIAAKRKAYLRDARYLDNDLVLVSDGSLFQVGRLVCRTLDNGGNFQDIVEAMVGADIDSDQVAAIVVAAVHNLCPGHRQFLTNWLDT